MGVDIIIETAKRYWLLEVDTMEDSCKKMRSTEILSLGSTAWRITAPLPMSIWSIGSVSINNKIYFIGGASVLVYEFDGDEWNELHKEKDDTIWHMDMLADRYYGNQAIAIDLATSGFDEFCN